MARTCQADDSLERQFEALLKRQAGPEVGLLVGKQAAAAKTILYGTIKTPAPEGLEPLVVVGAGAAAPAGAGSKAGKKPGAGGRAAGGAAAPGVVSVTLESEWITEHARQVARMLPGGLAVLGLYVFCPDAAYSTAVPQMSSLLAGLAAFCLRRPLPPASGAGSEPSSTDHLLLLHIDSTSRKQALRALPVSPSPTSASGAAVGSSLKPVELKYAPTLGNLVLLRCWHGVDLALPVPGTAGGGGPWAAAAAHMADGAAGTQMRRHLSALLAVESERIRSGIFVTRAGAMPPESSPVADALESAGQHPAAADTAVHVPVFDLTFMAPPRCRQLPSEAAVQSQSQQQQQQSQSQQQQAPGVSSRAVVGQARLRGCVQGLAFVSKREAVGRAVADLKADLLASLTARLELLVEEATRVSEQQQQEQQAQQQQRQPQEAQRSPAAAAHPLLSSPAQLAAGGGGCQVALPRRVLLPWLGGGLALCDYLLEGEPADAALERAQELLALQGSQVVELEAQARVAPAASLPWRPNVIEGGEVPAAGKGASPASRSASGLPCGSTLLASLAVAAVASALGVLSIVGLPGGPQ